MECPVRWMKYSPKPAFLMWSRTARSTSHPAMACPRYAFDHRLDSGSRASRTISKNFPHAIRRRLADEARPGDVVVDRPGRIFLRPDIEQNKVAFTNRR